MNGGAIIVAAISFAVIAGPVWAKLPAPTDAQKEAAAAAKAKAADAAKKDAELLNKYMDLTVEKYKRMQGQEKAGMAAPAATATDAAKK